MKNSARIMGRLMGNMAAPRFMFGFHISPHTYTFLMHALIFYCSFLHVCVNRRDFYKNKSMSITPPNRNSLMGVTST